MSKVYISSTSKDLRIHRRVVYDKLTKLGHSVKAMEDYVSQNRRPLAVCLEDIRNCEIFIGIYGGRYGSIPDHANPNQWSYIEFEYREAREHDKDIRVFFSEDITPDPLEDGEHQGKLARLRLLAGETLGSQFEDPMSLGVSVAESLRSPEDLIPSLLCYLPDRKQQRPALSGALKRDRKVDSVGVKVGVIDGLASQDHYQLVKVVCRYDVPRGRPIDPLVLEDIDWPTEKINETALRGRVMSELNRTLKLPETSSQESTTAVLNKAPGPVIVVSALDASRLAGRRLHAIERFLQFWRGWPIGDRRHPILALLCIEYRNSPSIFHDPFWAVRKSLVMAAVRKAKKECLRLDELGDVSEHYALKWSRLPEVRSVVGQRDIHASILGIFEAEGAYGMPMSTLAEKLRTMLNKTIST